MRFIVAIAAVSFAAPTFVQAQADTGFSVQMQMPTMTGVGGNGMTFHLGRGSLGISNPGNPKAASVHAELLHTDASLGMSLASTGTKRDTLGVFVESVASGGPAERAGIVEGDRIVAIDTADLHMAGFISADPSFRDEVVNHLRQTIQKLKAGTAVRVRVYSGGRIRTVSVTPDKWGTVYSKGDAAETGNAPFVIL